MTASAAPLPERPLRVLVITKLFPNAVDPALAVFNRHQFAALSRLCALDVRATIPWFPGIRLLRRWSPAGQFADLPAEESVDGMQVGHPRFLYLPKAGSALAPEMYAASLWPHLRRMAGKVDVVLGCWAFPDALAAAMIARRLGAAIVAKVHGSDLNILTKDPRVRRRLAAELPRVDRVIAVSRPLAEKVVELGVARDRVVLVPNGIDKELFRIRDRAESRQRLKIPVEGRLILYVGVLDRAKGAVDLVEAFERLAPAHPDLRLVIVGDGPERGRCEAAAASAKGRIVVTGTLERQAVAEWMGACDVLTLPSWAEGTPNVILEAFASGRRVVATNVGGIPDLITSPALGEMVPPREIPRLAEALSRAARSDYDPAIPRRAVPYDWAGSAGRVLDVLKAAVATRLG